MNMVSSMTKLHLSIFVAKTGEFPVRLMSVSKPLFLEIALNAQKQKKNEIFYLNALHLYEYEIYVDSLTILRGCQSNVKYSSISFYRIL